MQLTERQKLNLSFLTDYGLCLLFCVAAFGIECIPPFKRVAFTNDMSISYPLKADKIPGWSLPIITFCVPALFVILGGVWKKRKTNYHVVAVLGVAVSVSVTYIVTSILKVSFGGLRPDFKARCKPTDLSDIIMKCLDESKEVIEGRKSFPSGHTSLSFAGYGFTSFYIAEHIGLFKRINAFKAIIALLPWIVALLVCLTRLQDYRHHTRDVLGGALMGIIFAIISFILYIKDKRKFDEDDEKLPIVESDIRGK